MSFAILPHEAAQTLLDRQAAHESFTEWCKFVGYMPALHHELIIKQLEAVARGEVKRLQLLLPPGSAKSTYASVLFPPWYLAQHKDHAMIAASHTDELAERWGRRCRNLIEEHRYALEISLSSDSKAAGRWETREGGEYYAAGVGASITGRRADLVLIDDPVRNREDADSKLSRDKAWDWYLFDLLPRLKPDAAIVLIQCLTGDTGISMADGRRKRLDAIEPGEWVISWDGQKTVHSRVSAVLDNGLDQTFLIRTNRTEVRANRRHPFLVLAEEGLKWVRTRDLRPGMRIVRQDMARMRAPLASSMAAQPRPSAGECATVTTTKRNGLADRSLHRSQPQDGWLTAASGATGSILRILTECLSSRAVFAPFAGPMAALESPGTGSPVLCQTTTMTPGRFAGCYATTAIGSPDELEIPEFWNAPSSTSEIDTDAVVSVTPHDIERVFDLTVDSTHNFVANGLWTHNTRWHADDLAGRILEAEPGQWTIVKVPMEAETGDPLGRAPGERLWPEWFTAEMVATAKRDARVWSALYQQTPTPDTGAYFLDQWLHPVSHMPARQGLNVYGASDYAVTRDGGDYTVHIVVGVDEDGDMYVLDLWRGQTDSASWIDQWCDLVKLWRPIQWAEEAGQINASIGPFLQRRAREREAYTFRRQFPPRHDKAVRAQSIRARMATLGLYLPAGAPWRAEFEAELLRFPSGKHDDQVDALGLIGQLLDAIRKADLPPDPKQPKNPSGYSPHPKPREQRPFSAIDI